MEHGARPSCLFDCRASFNDFLKEMSAEADNEGYPNSLETLQAKAGVKLVLSDRNDPDNVGFVPIK